MPSLAAKKARTCLTKCRSSSDRLSQSLWSCARSSSSAVQKHASAFLYICHTFVVGKNDVKEEGVSVSGEGEGLLANLARSQAPFLRGHIR